MSLGSGLKVESLNGMLLNGVIIPFYSNVTPPFTCVYGYIYK